MSTRSRPTRSDRCSDAPRAASSRWYVSRYAAATAVTAPTAAPALARPVAARSAVSTAKRSASATAGKTATPASRLSRPARVVPGSSRQHTASRYSHSRG